MRHIAASTLVLAACAGDVLGQVETFSGDGGTINDQSDNWFPMFVDHGGSHVVVGVLLDVTHTWAGDLYIEVRHKMGGYGCVLLDRPGVPQSAFGNSDNFDGMYRFRDGAALIPEMATAAGLIPPSDYGPHSGQHVSGNATNVNGEWSLLISDRAGGDAGVLRSWAIELIYIPAPGTVSMVGLGGILAAQRRRS